MKLSKKMTSGLIALVFLLVAAIYTVTAGGDDRDSRPTAESTAAEDPAPTPSETENSTKDPGKTDDSAGSLYNGLNVNEEQARTTLDVLPIEEPESMSGYSDEFFPYWRSANKWGWTDVPDASDCDAREAALARDGKNVESNPETCHADSGEWTDPYTGQRINDSSDADADHILPRAAAFRAGAKTWNEEQRTIYANSPLVVVISGASANREKGDKGPEAWKPESREAWCPYSIRWIAVKNEFGLNLTSKKEKAALEEMLDTCEEEAA